MHPFHILGVAAVFGGSLFSAMHGSLVASSLLAETLGSNSFNAGYIFGQEDILLSQLFLSQVYSHTVLSMSLAAVWSIIYSSTSPSYLSISKTNFLHISTRPQYGDKDVTLTD